MDENSSSERKCLDSCFSLIVSMTCKPEPERHACTIEMTGYLNISRDVSRSAVDNVEIDSLIPTGTTIGLSYYSLVSLWSEGAIDLQVSKQNYTARQLFRPYGLIRYRMYN